MLAVLGYLVADLGVRALPPRLADAIARAIARLAYEFRVPARPALEANLTGLARVPRRRRDALARRAFEHFAVSFVDFLRLGHLPASALAATVEIRGRHHLERARRGGRGVILLSAHVGNWEWGAAFLASQGTPLHVLARPHASRWVERFVARRRRERGVGVLPARSPWSRAAEALRRGEWVALMGDRPARRGRSVCAWAAALARRTGAVVLPAVIVRVAPGRYAACFERPVAAGAPVTGHYREAIAAYVRRYPEQWFAFEPLHEGLA